MNTFAWIVGGATVAAFSVTGAVVLTWQPRVAADARKFGFSRVQYSLIGVAQLLGASGVLAGLVSPSFRTLAGTAAACLAVLALAGGGFHIAYRDHAAEVAPGVILGGLAALTSAALFTAA